MDIIEMAVAIGTHMETMEREAKRRIAIVKQRGRQMREDSARRSAERSGSAFIPFHCNVPMVVRGIEYIDGSTTKRVHYTPKAVTLECACCGRTQSTPMPEL